MTDWVYDVLVDLERFCGDQKYGDTRKMLADARAIYRDETRNRLQCDNQTDDCSKVH